MPRIFPSTRARCAWTITFLAASLLVAQESILHIKVVAGDGAQQAAGAHAKPLSVEVTDATGRSVAGARVSFQVPEEGPGGAFPNGLRTDIAITDSNGHATSHALQLNRVAGAFSVRITAAKEQARAGTIARQSIGGAEAQPESADRKAPAPAITAPAAKEPAPPPAQPAPKHPTQPPPEITVPGTTATQPVKLAAAQPAPPVAPVRTVAETPHGVPTIIVTQKSGKSVAEIGADRGHGSHKKWLWIGLMAAGGAGAAFAATSMGAAHSPAAGAGTAAAITTGGITIGPPTITIGKP